MRGVLAAAAAMAIAVGFAAAAAADTVVIRAGRLIDPETRSVRENQVIIIEGARIKAVGPAGVTAVPPDARLIDLSAATVLPGLIDTHTHLTSDPTISTLDRYSLTAPRFGILGAAAARQTLLAGITTVRNLGAPFFADVALRESVERGDIPGPRIFAAGSMISMTGGHGDDNRLAPDYQYVDDSVADGPDALITMVRRHAKYRVDIIKFATTGGVFSANTLPSSAHFSQAEASTIVAEAHELGRTVAVHAHGAEGIKRAIRAGADTIEHASLIDEEGLKLAKSSGVILSMDIYNTDYTQAEGRKNGVPAINIQKDRDIGEVQRENFRRAVKMGVRLSFGTDAGIYPHGDNAKQLSVMVRYGMTPMQAIEAATLVGAQSLKKTGDFGTIAPGRFADILAVANDPLADISALEKPLLVMKGGQVYRGPAEACAAAPAAWACEPPAR